MTAQMNAGCLAPLLHCEAREPGNNKLGMDQSIQRMETRRMTRAGWKEIAVLLVCVSIPCWYSYGKRTPAGEWLMADFGELYFGARCAMHGQDPYDPGAMLREFKADGGRFAPSTTAEGVDQIVVTRTVNLPTALLLTVPFALLPWWLAQNVWTILIAALLVTAAFLIWDLGAGAAPLLWAALAGFMLAESYALFKFGNVAGIVVSFSMIAVWCFLKHRHAWIGVLLLALSLVVKPHDSGFIWLYFLLAGGPARKRALQSLGVVAVLAAGSAIWITSISPHWLQEIHTNLAFASSRGGTSDPGPAGLGANTAAAIIDLQGVLSGIKDDPRFYNPAAYLIVGLLILTLFFATVRNPPSAQKVLFALAAIAPLTLLPVYHRVTDAGVLLLALPACATLWREHAPERWIALGLTSAGILFTASTPLAFLAVNFQAIATFAYKLPGRLPAAIILRPTPVVLLAMGCFYLWVYLRNAPARVEKPSAATHEVSTAF